MSEQEEIPIRCLQDALSEVEESEDRIRHLGMKSLQAADGDLYPYDFLVSSAASRAVCLSQGFRELMGSNNYVAAYPLVRLAMDCCFCLVGGHWVDNLHEFANHVIAGRKLSSYRAKNGEPLSDRFLRNKMDEKYPDLGVNEMYKQCSSWIHMSTLHVRSATQKIEHESSDNGQLGIQILVGGVRELPESEYIRTALSLFLTNAILCQLIIEWHNTKTVGKAEAAAGRFEGKLYSMELPQITRYVRSGC